MRGIEQLPRAIEILGLIDRVDYLGFIRSLKIWMYSIVDYICICTSRASFLVSQPFALGEFP